MGIYDEANLTPIIWKGITATPYWLDYMEEPDFLIDTSIFPGSSGSPVFIYDVGSHSDRKGNLIVGSRVIFIGILTRVFFRKNDNTLDAKPIPGAPYTSGPALIEVDLGLVFKPTIFQDLVIQYLENSRSLELDFISQEIGL